MGEGLWASYVNCISIEKSCGYTRIKHVDALCFRLQHTRFRIRNGNSFFLSDNWTGRGSLLDCYDLHNCDAFKTLRVCDLYTSTGWHVSALSQFFPPTVEGFVQMYSFPLLLNKDEII